MPTLLALAKRPIIKWTLQIGILTIIFALIGSQLARQWAQIQEETFTVNWPLLLLAQGGFIVAMFMLAGGSYGLARHLAEDVPPPVAVWHAFAVGTVAKYLPGSVWSLPSRAVLYRGLGITRGVEMVYWETGLILTGAVLITPLAATILLGDAFFIGVMAVIWGGGLAFVLATALLRWKRFTWIELRIRLGALPPILAWYVLVWLTFGGSFALLIAALGGGFDPRHIGLFACGWAMGFLSILTPGGIGVRDGVLIVGISAAEPIPLVAALAARICWTLAEVAALGLIALWRMRSPQTQTGELAT